MSKVPPEDKKNSDLGMLTRLFPYLWQHPGLFVFSIVLYPLVALTAMVPPLLTKVLIDDSLAAGRFALRWDPRPDGIEALYLRPQIFLGWVAAAFIVSVCLDYALGVISQYSMSVVGLRALKSLRQDLFAKVQRLPTKFFDHQPVGKILTRLTNDVEALVEVFSTGTVTAITDILRVAVILVTMLSLDVKLTLLSLVMTPVLIGVSVIFRRYARSAFRRIRKSLSELNTFLAEHVRGMAVVQLFRQQESTAQRFEVHNRALRDANQQAILFDAMLFAVVQALGVVTVAVLLGGASNALVDGTVQVGLLVAFVGLSRRIFEPLRDLAQKFTMLQQALAAAERVLSLLDEDEVETSPGRGKVVLRNLTKGIEFKDVWFRYPGLEGKTNPWVLKGLDLRIAAGEKVALVGATGSGKSTILRLLNRSYELDKGSLRIDGLDVDEFELSSLRRAFGFVLQDVFLFEGTFTDNLSMLGRVDAQQVRSATNAVGADALIDKYGGYEGTVRAQGANMSVGERQLLSFARALAADPQVLVLDEATSHVDSHTEAQIQAALAATLQNRSALLVAHRLATIQRSDRIVVLAEGAVSEEGDHESLMKKGGFYAHLVDLQNAQGPSVAH